MFKELFRFEGNLTIEGVNAGCKEMTGEDDFLGLENETDLNRMIKSGFIEQDGKEIIIYEDCM